MCGNSLIVGLMKLDVILSYSISELLLPVRCFPRVVVMGHTPSTILMRQACHTMVERCSDNRQRMEI